MRTKKHWDMKICMEEFEETYYDSANISESYTGIVLPLTCSFIKFVYKTAYIDLLKHSGLESKKIDQNKFIFENLLGFRFGHVYYNMNNWYRMSALMPGFKRNKTNLELMITSNVKETIDRNLYPSAYLKLKYPFIFLTKYISSKSTFKKFDLDTSEKIKYFRSVNIKNLNMEDSIKLFNEMNAKLLSNWYVTLENDFLLMTFLGMLTKSIKPTELQALMRFKSEAGSQLIALIKLSKELKNSDIWAAIERNNDKEFSDYLEANPSMNTLVQNYFESYGGRFANELKLESVDIEDDITKLFELLRIYASKDERLYEYTEKNDSIYSGILTNYKIRQFKKHAKWREKFRLYRSNVFSIVRKIFNHIGDLHYKKNLIDKPEDIFYLNLQEVLDFKTQLDLKSIISTRKKEYEKHLDITAPTYFKEINGVISSDFNELSPKSDAINKSLQARGCSPGVIKGRVRVFKKFYIPKDMDFDILVTSHTDPGWMTLIAASKGMIIEHGGILSHASIVARELNIPTVIGASNATSNLKDGQIVEINGSTGSIMIYE